MPSVYQLKSRFQELLRPSVKRLAAMSVTANQVTMAAIVLSIFGGSLIAFFPDRSWPYLLLLGVLFFRMALNAVDGMLAREHAMQSRLGAMLNELGDVVSDTALYLPFAMVPGVSSGLVAGAVILAILTEMTGVIGVQLGSSRRYDGPMGKSDRAFVFGGIALLLGLGLPAGAWTNAILAVMLILLAITVFNRARSAIRESSPHG
jgi:CDP-diacylglycerol--glycerol-3-phosphate 3-phosphatidyltransferase